MIITQASHTGYTFTVLSRKPDSGSTKYEIFDEQTKSIFSGYTTSTHVNGLTTFTVTGTTSVFQDKRFYILKLYNGNKIICYYKIYAEEAEKIIQVYTQNNFKEVVKKKTTYKIKQ